MNALRIFAHASRRRPLPRPSRPTRAPAPTPLAVVEDEESTQTEVTTAVVVDTVEPEVTTAIEQMSCEQTMIDVLTSSPHYGETIELAYRRKERELTELFATLSRAEAATLHKRLVDPQAEDQLAMRFARLVVDRRLRLLAMLADAPRREARRR